MVNSRRKGAEYERKVAGMFREHGYMDARRGQQYCGLTGAADVVGVPALYIECKRREAFNLHDAIEKAIAESKAAGRGEFPVVVHQKDRSRTLVTMAFDDWIKVFSESSYADRK